MSSSSAILFIIEDKRADIENLVKYAILRVRKFLCLCRWCSHLLMLMLPSENQPQSAPRILTVPKTQYPTEHPRSFSNR